MGQHSGSRVILTLSSDVIKTLQTKKSNIKENMAVVTKRYLIYGLERDVIKTDIERALVAIKISIEDLKLRIKKLREGELVSSILNKESEKLLTRLLKEHVGALEQIFTDIASHIKDLATRTVGGLESLETGLSKISKNQDAFAKTLSNFSIGLQDLSDRLLTRGHS